jgi:hypothetical protein
VWYDSDRLRPQRRPPSFCNRAVTAPLGHAPSALSFLHYYCDERFKGAIATWTSLIPTLSPRR